MSCHERDLVGVRAFLRDKVYVLVAGIVVALIAGAFLIAFRVNPEMIITLVVLWVVFIGFILTVEYLRKRSFYRSLLENIVKLDQAYLVLETIPTPKFYDGVIMSDALYRINKSMLESIQNYRTRAQEFQEYAEMWIHEVKTPLATLALMSHDPKLNEQIKRMDDYVEQILYFARAENAERDYLIRRVDLADVIHTVAVRNREILQAQNIELDVENVQYPVYTDTKWLEFILNQILNNSIKYGAHRIHISAVRTPETTTLKIRDDGIGISPKDLPKVFEKSFTGQNGRHSQGTVHRSTGMGLYLAHTLCQKLGHRIEIASEDGAWTQVDITFSHHGFYTEVAAGKGQAQ